MDSGHFLGGTAGLLPDWPLKEAGHGLQLLQLLARQGRGATGQEGEAGPAGVPLQDGFLDQLSVQSSSSEDIMNSSSDDGSSNDLNTSEEFYFNK